MWFVDVFLSACGLRFVGLKGYCTPESIYLVVSVIVPYINFKKLFDNGSSNLVKVIVKIQVLKRVWQSHLFQSELILQMFFLKTASQSHLFKSLVIYAAGLHLNDCIFNDDILTSEWQEWQSK